jgi:uncharacterized protein YjbJ (UPF0337 family)
MEWNQIEASWGLLKSRVKKKWRRLTEEDLELIAGSRDQLGHKLKERYGFADEYIQKELDDWSRWQNLQKGPEYTPLIPVRRASR